MIDTVNLPQFSLTTALALLGGLVLLALVLYNAWSTRRLRPPAPAEVNPHGRLEPALGADGQAAHPGAASPNPPPNNAFADTHPGPLANMPRRPLRPEPRLDALIDAIAPLALDAPITGDLALSHLPVSRRAGTKPFFVEGLDTENGEWTALHAGRRYGELQAGVQLANRTGALNEIEYSEFVQTLQAFADAVGARPDLPDMLDVVARARELDAMSSPLDAQLTVTLRTNGVAWSVGFVQQVAGRLGLVPGAVPGRLVLPAGEEGAPPLLVLALDAQAALAALDDAAPSAAIRECTLTLDVPQTPASAEPFPAWHLLGKKLSDDLDATAMDDKGQPITLHAYANIGQELDALYTRLEALGLPAGSAAARRLFS